MRLELWLLVLSLFELLLCFFVSFFSVFVFYLFFVRALLSFLLTGCLSAKSEIDSNLCPFYFSFYLDTMHGKKRQNNKLNKDVPLVATFSRVYGMSKNIEGNQSPIAQLFHGVKSHCRNAIGGTDC